MLALPGDAPDLVADPVRWLDYILYVPEYYSKATLWILQEAITHPPVLAQGLMFAGSLLAILAAHEAGHYIACRRYNVRATLPFFIPAPPLVPTGTFGAFIRIESAIPSRRALFDIGVSGPLAGFIVAVPVMFAGLLSLHPAAPVTGPGFVFNEPLMMRLPARLLGIDLSTAQGNPFYFAAWFGLLVTSLNLLPVGQLDGGHAVYALFGRRRHRIFGRIAFASMAILAVLGWFVHHSPSGILYTVLLAVMLRVRHPETEDAAEPLGRARQVIAILTLAVFALSFWPFPVTITQ